MDSADMEGILTLDGHVFKLIDGLWGTDTVTFESMGQSGYYVCRRNGQLIVTRGDVRDEQFRRDSSFKPHENKFFEGSVA